MSILRTTYLEQLPDRDRWGNIDYADKPITVHIATSGWDAIHLMLEDESEQNAIEVNLTIEDALQLLAGLAEAIEGAQKGKKQ
jgi:hypothetical protein